MRSTLVTRPADDPLVHSVSLWTIGDDPSLARPDGRWDLVILKTDDEAALFVAGQTTAAVPLPFVPGQEILTISFRPGAYLTTLPASALVDRAELLESRRRTFRLVSDTLEIPRFDNAEDLVRLLRRRGILEVDELVTSYFSEHPLAASARTVQRHFLAATGMSLGDFRQIERAQHAFERLERGIPASQVALDCGYADQAHMVRSLKRFMGQTPGQIQPRR